MLTKRFKYSVISGLFFGIIISTYALIKYKKQDLAIVMGIFCFILFTLISFFKFFAKINTVKFKYSLKGNPDIVYSSPANYYKDGISIGGRLYLLNDKIIFQTNFINSSSKHELCIYMHEITTIYFEKTYGLLDKDIILTTENESYRFMTSERQQFRELIMKKNTELNSVT